MKVLLAVDDKVFGEALADFVTKHQWKPDTCFKVIHVVSPVLVERTMGPQPLFMESVRDDVVKEAQALVRYVAIKLRDRFKTTHVEEEVYKGRPVDIILDVAAEWEADMVCVGSHGRHGVSRFLLGSVSQGVVSHCPCSIAVVRLPEGKERDETAKKSEVAEVKTE